MKSKEFSPVKKDKTKIVRSIIEGLILCIVIGVLIKSFVNTSSYKPYDINSVSNKTDSKFIAISYFGVDRTGDENLISTTALEKQLKALKDNGYVTITEQDILDYYNKGKELPEKSLFLMFEDGRKDTAIFAEKILESYNYKATMFSYADKFEKNDQKFLMPKDLLELQKSSFWELGTNGYRLEYINVFNKASKYLGRLNSVEFSKESKAIGRDYNHYLMDYIRDENGIPVENYEEMKDRIDNDYKALSDIYNKNLGFTPSLYALMHSNTGKFGTNDKVSEINGQWIKELFSMNFNREGYALNTKSSSIYDLTRVQPQAYWSTNHLLMKVLDDTKKDVDFVKGDEKKAEKFQQIKGQSEFVDDKVIITSLPKDKGLIKLVNSENYKDIKISALMQGNIVGSQAIYLRANENLSSSIKIQLINNTINVMDNLNGNSKIIYSMALGDKDEEYDIKKSGNKKIDVMLKDDKLTLSVDDKQLAENIEVSNKNEGSIFIEATWENDRYSQRNISDDIYDGVFKGIKVTDLNDKILFDSSLKGLEAVNYKIKSSFNNLVNWFIKNL